MQKTSKENLEVVMTAVSAGMPTYTVYIDADGDLSFENYDTYLCVNARDVWNFLDSHFGSVDRHE